jgi:hypothetical protein
MFWSRLFRSALKHLIVSFAITAGHKAGKLAIKKLKKRG